MKRWLAIFLLLPALAQAFPVNSVLDTFATPSDPIAGIWTNDLFAFGLGCEVTGGVVQKDAGAGTLTGCWITNSFTGPLQEVYATLPDMTNWTVNLLGTLYLCLSSPGTSVVDGYGTSLRRDSGTDRFETVRLENNVETQIGADTLFEPTNGDKYGMELTAPGVMDIWIKDGAAAWVNSSTRSDSGTPYNCANTHLGLRTRSSIVRFDDLGGGNTVIPAVGGNPFIRLLLR